MKLLMFIILPIILSRDQFLISKDVIKPDSAIRGWVNSWNISSTGSSLVIKYIFDGKPIC